MIACLAQCVGTIVSMAVAIFAFKSWRENRKSVNFELIQKLEETFDAKVSGAFRTYFKERKDFKGVGSSFYPMDAEKAICDMLRWYSSLGMMLPLGIVAKAMIERYKYQFRIVAKCPIIREYFKELVKMQDDSKLAAYCGFFRLIEIFGDKDLKNEYKTKILKGCRR